MTSIIRTGSLSGNGPVTLTKAQFGATPIGKKPGANYSRYLGYLANRRGAKLAQTNTDPFAQTSPQSIDQTINRFTGMYGAPQTDSQIQTSAQSQIDPIIAAITGNIGKQTKQSTDAISANSAALAKALGSIDYGAPYAAAQHDQAAVDAALQQSLNGQGAALAGDLNSRLGVIGDPAVGQAASAIGQRGTAIGTNELASGSANLGSLIAQAAAAKSYGQKQPGIASLAGLQDIAGVSRDATNKIGDQTSQVMQLLPQIVSSLRSERSNLTSNKTSLAAQLYQVLTGQNVTKATAKEGLANTAFDNNLATAQTYGFDPVTGTPTLAATKAVDAAAAKAKPKPLTTTDRKRLVSDLDTYYWGIRPKQHYDATTNTWVDIPNTDTPGVDYSTAVRNLMNAYGLSEAEAMKYANGVYPPGEDGRPKSAAQKKTAGAVKAGLGVPKLAGPLAGLAGAPVATPAKPKKKSPPTGAMPTTYRR